MVSSNHESQNRGRFFFEQDEFFKDRLHAQAKVGTFKVNDKCVTTHYLYLTHWHTNFYNIWRTYKY